MATIAIMQPYFLPYAGYFRLIARSDVFVIYDCVQFPRRGWVHRNKLLDAAGAEQWLTLPLRPAPQDVLIRDLEFPEDAPAAIAERLRPFPLVARDGVHAPLLDRMLQPQGRPADYIAASWSWRRRCWACAGTSSAPHRSKCRRTTGRRTGSLRSRGGWGPRAM